ncbi:MAG: hypothetical protein KBH86_12545 [Syntrophorhabdus sp.]|nr:hypothetical protein [Syntrophorhabdus sp.]MDI9557305.1 hypothetical protein [Pseudomonadota bacterium]
MEVEEVVEEVVVEVVEVGFFQLVVVEEVVVEVVEVDILQERNIHHVLRMGQACSHLY